MAERSSFEFANEINSVLSQKLQGHLKCGICCSTLKKPMVPSCNHAFCSDCLYECFKRKSIIECPICRTRIKKRSCVVSDSLQAMVDAYLQLARNFKRDVKEHTISLPKEEAFMESQAIIATQAADSPLRSFQLNAKFAVPIGQAPNRRRNPEAALAHARAIKMPRLTSVKEENVEAGTAAVIITEKTEIELRPANNVGEDDEDILVLDDPPNMNRISGLDFGFSVAASQKIHNGLAAIKRRPKQDISNKVQKVPPRSKQNGVDDNSPDVAPAQQRLVTLLKKPVPLAPATTPTPLVRPYKRAKSSSSSRAKSISSSPVSSVRTRRCLRAPMSTGGPPPRRFPPPMPDSIFEGLLDAVEERKAYDNIYSIDAAIQLVPGLVSILLQDQDRLLQILDLKPERICPKCTENSTCDPPPSISSGNDCIVLEDAATISLTSSGSSKVSNVPVPPLSETHNKENCSSANSVVPSPSLTASARVSRRGTLIKDPTRKKPEGIVVAFSRLESRDDENLLHEFQICFPQVTVMEEVTENCTHFVLFNSVDRTFRQRSLRYVSAIAYECEMISRDWVLQSVKRSKLMSTHHFIIQYDKELPNLDAAWIRCRNGPRLLDGMKFYLPFADRDSNIVPRKALLDIIEACGGVIITNQLAEVKAPDCAIIFPALSKRTSDARRFEDRYKVPVLSADWILIGVAEWRLPKFDNYRVYKCTPVC